MRRARVLIPLAIIAVVALTTVFVTTAVASDGSNRFKTNLSGFNEDPLTISTAGGGTFKARINRAGDAIAWELSYSSTTSTVQQAHIHFGGPFQSGGIVVFLCSNLGNGPAGTQACPAAPATLTGTIDAADVIAVANQNIPAGGLANVIAAMRAGRAYANVHTMNFPGGEIRGQLGDHDHGHHHDHDHD